MVVHAKPSQIHAALLMAGFEPGSPGRWTYEDNKLGTIDPTGEKLELCVRYVDRTGRSVEHPVRKWIRDGAARNSNTAEETNSVATSREFPDLPWVFGGSIIAPNPSFM